MKIGAISVIREIIIGIYSKGSEEKINKGGKSKDVSQF